MKLKDNPLQNKSYDFALLMLKDSGHLELKYFNSFFEKADEIGKNLFSILKTTRINK